MFERIFLHKLSKTKPFLIFGAKGSGKTTLTKQFGSQFKNVIHLDLDTIADRNIFFRSSNPEEVLKAISFLKEKEILGKETLLILDEIGRSPETSRWVNQVQSHARPSIIATASFQTEQTHLLTNPPTGLMDPVFLPPFTFEEFIMIMDDQAALDAYREAPVPVYAHGKLLHYFHIYALIGGMPEIMMEYAEHRHLKGLHPVYEKIETSFLQSIENMNAGKTRRKLAGEVLQNIYPYASTRIHFKRFGNLEKQSREMGQAFRMLEEAFLLQLIYPVTSRSLPMHPDKKRFPRVQVIDSGMVNYFSGTQKPVFRSQDMNALFKGQIARQIAGQEILATEIKNDGQRLNFWVRDKPQSTAEIDFLLEYQDMAIPVEVKSGEPGRLRSLHQFMDMAPHPFAIQLHASKTGIQQTQTIKGKKFFLLSLPYFLAGKIRGHLEGFKKFVEI